MTTDQTHLLVWLHRLHLLCLYRASLLPFGTLPPVSSFNRTVNSGTLHSQAKGRVCGPSWTHQAVGIFHLYRGARTGN